MLVASDEVSVAGERSVPLGEGLRVELMTELSRLGRGAERAGLSRD